MFVWGIPYFSFSTSVTESVAWRSLAGDGERARLKDSCFFLRPRRLNKGKGMPAHTFRKCLISCKTLISFYFAAETIFWVKAATGPIRGRGERTWWDTLIPLFVCHCRPLKINFFFHLDAGSLLSSSRCNELDGSRLALFEQKIKHAISEFFTDYKTHFSHDWCNLIINAFWLFTMNKSIIAFLTGFPWNHDLTSLKKKKSRFFDQPGRSIKWNCAG